MNNLLPDQGYSYPQSGAIASPPDQASVAASAFSGTQLSQSKRQNSMSAYNNNPSLKRAANPLQMQFLMQSNVPVVQAFPSAASPARFASAASSRRNVRKSGQFLPGQPNKTPTPTNYDIPLSPGANIALQNNLDLSGSSPTVDQQVSATGINKDSSLPLLNQNLGSQQPLQPDHRFSQLLQQPQQPQQRAMSDEEQQLATKLKETYKNIVNFEEVVQKSCIELTIKINQSNFSSLASPYTSSMYGQQQTLHLSGSPVLFQSAVSTSSTELSNNLWTIYHHNVTLLNNYYDFLITALKPTANSTQMKTGKNIVDLYKIPRRMWVYGIVGFLEVLKNIMSIFLDHEIYLCFIAHCFNIVSNLTDPALEMEGWWCEKLGDLSRMAIALYSSRFIDWKISAEYWYSVAMKTMYGHGKIYYHICTVQQDNLDALVNIGKSVVCRDPFVPTQQYLRLVVENICTQRNILSLLELPIIDFIKIHKVLLSIHTNSINANEASLQTENIHDSQLQYGIDLVTRYGLTFGCDSHGFNFFTGTFCIPGAHNKYGTDPFNQYLKQQHEQDQQTNTLDTLEKMNFWFNKGSLFAIANVNHLIGFGDPKNPFAKIFQLPEALKERKDKKDRKRKSKSQTSQEDASELGANISNLNGSEGQLLVASELSVTDWFYCLTYINKSVLELSFRILNHYLIGPKLVSTCHVIVWLYFLIAVGEASNKYHNSKSMFMWLFRKFFPWESFINYLNTLVAVATNNPHLSNMCRDYLVNHADYLQYFNENEFLPEVWKCWGTLWFDVISPKQDYNDLNSAGVLNPSLFDLPICGTSPVINIHGNNGNLRGNKSKSKDQQERENDERLVRIILLARILADKYDFGVVRTLEGFKYDEKIYSETESDYLLTSAAPTMTNELFAFIRQVVYGDGRLVQDNFVIPISPGNLVQTEHLNMFSAEDKDDHWFRIRQDAKWNQIDDANLEEEMVTDDEDLIRYAESRFDDDESDYQQQLQTQISGLARKPQDHHFYHQLHHPQAVMDSDAHKFEEFYADNYVVTSDLLPVIGSTDIQIAGDLGDRMDSSLTYITLDTNIWLKHCGRIFKCVRNGVFKVLIPLIVFQELRSLRKSAEATIADAATRSVIIIRELYLAREILPLRFDGTVASDINETTEFENNSNWMSNVDLTILNVVNEHDEISKKLLKGLHCTINGQRQIILDSKHAKMFRYCILITDDRNMRLRAKTSGLTSYQSKWLFGQLEENFPDKCID